MSDYEMIAKYRKTQLNKVEIILKKVATLNAFISVYGALYDNYYYAYILNLNNISEHYLENFNSEYIDRLYDIYSIAKEEEKSEKEIFEQLRIVLQKLPAFTVTETSVRRLRYQ